MLNIYNIVPIVCHCRVRVIYPRLQFTAYPDLRVSFVIFQTPVETFHPLFNIRIVGRDAHYKQSGTL